MPVWYAVAAGVIGGVAQAALSDSPDYSDPYGEMSAQIGREQWERYKQLAFPIEDQTAKEVAALGGPEDIAREEGLAAADVGQNFAGLRKSAREASRQRGIDPSSGNAESDMNTLDIAQAGATAGATTQARNFAKQYGLSRRMDFLAQEAGIPGQSTAAVLGAGQLGLATSNAAYLRSRQNAMDTGYLFAPAYKAVGDWAGSKASAWWNSSPGMSASERGAAEAYRGMDIPNSGQYMQSGTTEYSGFAGGGKLGLKKRAPVTLDGDGRVVGPGTETSDSVPAVVDGQEPVALSDGEQVMNTEAVRIVGRDFLHALNKIGLMRRYDKDQREDSADDEVPGLKDGWRVQRPMTGKRLERWLEANA